MLYQLSALVLFLVSKGSANEVATYKAAEWEGKRDAKGNAYTQGSAFICKTQPSAFRQGMTCNTNADCGSALCIHVEVEGVKGKQCGCGDFERRFNHNYVTICSCKYSVNPQGKNLGTCLPIWRNTIMCKFACKNCFNCAEKNETSCAEDGTCTMVSGLCTLNTADEECFSIGQDRAKCEQSLRCRFQHNGGTEHTNKCVPRTYIETVNSGPNKNCPIGTTRMRDRYQNPANGTFFDVCVTARGPMGNPIKEIKECLFYEWDGDSCKTCNASFKLATVALDRGNGRLKENALCVKADNPMNKNCEVFKDDQNASAGAEHHFCTRCKEGYRWEFHGTELKKGRCAIDKITVGSLIAIDLRAVIGVAVMGVGLAAYFTTGRVGFWKGLKVNQLAGDIDVQISK